MEEVIEQPAEKQIDYLQNELAVRHRELVAYMNKCEILQSLYKKEQEDNKYLRAKLQSITDTEKATSAVLTKQVFMQQYVLARASRIDSHPAISAMVKDAERAHELIVKTCNKEDS